MKIIIGGEDAVTFAVIKRLVAYCSDNFEIIEEVPARGGEVKNRIPQFNILSATFPIVLLIDLDCNDCAPQLLNQLIKNKSDNFIFNIAVDEAEAWLMADREGFAAYFKIKIDEMPISLQTRQGGRKLQTEMNFSVKSSWYLTHELIKKSRSSEFIAQLTPKKGATKGSEYNSCIIPFIENHWNIDNAKQNSDSLNRMIVRLEKLANQDK